MNEPPRRVEGGGRLPQPRASWTRCGPRSGLRAGAGAGRPLLSLNFARLRSAAGEARHGAGRLAGVPAPLRRHHMVLGREAGEGRGGAAPQLSLLVQFLPVSALNSGEAGSRRGAGQGGLRACCRGASPRTSARRPRCLPPSDAPSRLHASPAAAAPGGCGSSSSPQLSGDCAWLQVRGSAALPRRRLRRARAARRCFVPSQALDGAGAGRLAGTGKRSPAPARRAPRRRPGVPAAGRPRGEARQHPAPGSEDAAC